MTLVCRLCYDKSTMKLRSTTPVSTSFVAKFLLVTSVILMAFAVPVQLSSRVYADKYDDQIRALQQQVSVYQAQANELGNQAKTLQSALATITAQKAEIQAQLDISQAKYDQLVAQIADTEKKIKDNQDALGITIANLYVDQKISPLEMLASSQNISDYLDKQEYRNSIRDQLTSTIAQIKDLKAQLDIQKSDVEKVLAQQKSQRDVLAAKESEQQTLLDQTKGQEAAYQQLSAQKAADIAAVQSQQRAAIAALTNNGRNTAGSVGNFQFRNFSGNQGNCGGGYPAHDTGIYGQVWGCNYELDYNLNADDWALYNRECVSYAAWAAYTRFGKNVTSFRGMGMAYQVPNTAAAYMGADVDNTPSVGSVAITPQQPFTPSGHAMVVEEVYGDGWIRVSQYNFAGTGEYSTMDLKASSAVYVHFQNR